MVSDFNIHMYDHVWHIDYIIVTFKRSFKKSISGSTQQAIY